jgi:hypothetical protein
MGSSRQPQEIVTEKKKKKSEENLEELIEKSRNRQKRSRTMTLHLSMPGYQRSSCRLKKRKKKT